MKQIVEFDTPTQLADPLNDRLPIKLEKQDSFIITYFRRSPFVVLLYVIYITSFWSVHMLESIVTTRPFTLPCK